jgi:DNA helicase-2/ATP-dependent DNA helicase PcrA
VVLKVATLLAREVRPPRGVACITFSTDAAREFTTRLRRYGVRPDRRLFLGTVHGFCFTRILRPYARLAGEPGLASRTVLTAQRQRGFIERALDLEGVGEDPRYFDATLARIRKAIACEEDLAPFDDRHVLVARRFDSLLSEQGVIDFDAMTFEALRLVRNVPAVGDLLVARYPWLAVDEYQDLGGPLHNIVLELRAVGARVFAVGDPDQCVYGFTGANPRYLHDLTEDEEFHTVRLRFNYRSGQRLIDAAEGALGATRDYRADPDRVDAGEVALRRCDDGLEAQAEVVASEIVPSLLAAGLPAHEIAVLYPRRGTLLTLVLEHLQAAGIPFLWEKDISFSDQPVIKWLQRCAAWALNPGSSDVDTFADLVAPYLWMVEAGAGSHDHRGLAGRARLFAALDGAVSVHDDLGQ